MAFLNYSIIRKLIRSDVAFANFSVHVALDHQLATEEILQDASHNFQPLLIIIPVRLGLHELNPIYIDGLKRCLELDASMGIIGNIGHSSSLRKVTIFISSTFRRKTKSGALFLRLRQR